MKNKNNNFIEEMRIWRQTQYYNTEKKAELKCRVVWCNSINMFIAKLGNKANELCPKCETLIKNF